MGIVEQWQPAAGGSQRGRLANLLGTAHHGIKKHRF